jgi:ABC-2 type transport system permease protein
MMQIARFPLQIYPQRMHWVLLTVLPAAFLTTFPAQALLGRVSAGVLLPALALAALLLFCSHRFFNYALKFYGSASS